ncbi:AraC family transcriptional regulator [Vallitalea longa]|uniref:AraC family transcriptional regulator n=1 Tax=Vallitalea longa TaxID=2936439 RepID=A0A9W5YBS5_9FIRM|nr:AraC family transcriptional regulator [Vallitalea longa]GKX31087.1 AraC family transcriptional regulator [Vallitalea longa]
MGIHEINKSEFNIEKELTIYHKGYQNCSKGSNFGPFIRDHYIIHFVIEGKGIFRTNDTIYNLHEKQAFLICPNVLTYYEADKKAPWNYYWIGFHGENVKGVLDACNLSYENPILSFDKNKIIEIIVKSIYNLENTRINFELRSKGLLYLLMDELTNISDKKIPTMNDNTSEVYVQNAISYIKRNYSEDIKIKDIANFLNLDRSYLTRIFKEVLCMTPQDYLIHFRIEKAKGLLRSTDLSVSAVGRSVGYPDPYYFSKIFKKMVNLTPKSYGRI